MTTALKTLITEAALSPSDAYDEVLAVMFAKYKADFLSVAQIERHSAETESTLRAKAKIIKDHMAQGMLFHTARDLPSVRLGSKDSEYVYAKYIDAYTKKSLEVWRNDTLKDSARRSIEYDANRLSR